MTKHAFFTIGHSTRTIEQFVELLRVADVKHVVDVRTVPRSRTNPQYNSGAFPDSLAPFGIAYSHHAALGGLRRQSKDVADEVNGWWRNRSFHNYADYALSAQFQAGLDRLIELGSWQTCAVMCSEAVWWRCHRRIIADHLIHRHESVYHLMGKNRMQLATLTAAARDANNSKLVYPEMSTSES